MNRHIRLIFRLAAFLMLLLVGVSKPAGADSIALPVVEGYDAHEADVEMPAPKAILTRKEG